MLRFPCVPLLFISTLISTLALAHGGDDGPSTLEQEFAKLSHIHLPINYSTDHGFILGYELGGAEEDHSGHNDHAIDLNVHPVSFGGLDRIRRLVCQDVSTTDSIEPCPESAPYLLIENRKWDLGLGVELDIHLPIPSVGAGFGVTYIAGKNYISARMLANRYESRAPLALPFTQKEFENWRVGDQLSYYSKGSVVVNAFIGVEPFFHVGPEVIHTGVHRISARKTANDTLLVEFSKIRSDAIGVEANAIVMNAESSSSKGTSNTIVYEFQFHQDKDFEPVQALFAGRLDLVNQAILKTRLSNRGLSFSANFGLPLLYFKGGSFGIYQSQGEAEEKEDGETHHHRIFSSTRLSERFSRGVLSKHAWENRNLTTTIVRDEHHPDESVLSAILNWSYSRDEVRDSQFSKRMRKWAELTGIHSLSSLDLPFRKNGYVKLDLTINLSGANVLSVLSPEEKTALEDFQKRADYQGLSRSLLSILETKQDQLSVSPEIRINLEGENFKKTTLKMQKSPVP